jgi:hypothetical protein
MLKNNFLVSFSEMIFSVKERDQALAVFSVAGGAGRDGWLRP